MRVCSHCGIEKEITEYFQQDTPYKKARPRGECKVCTRKKNRERYSSAQIREKHIKSMYGITMEEYNSILKSQNGGCYICGAKTANKRTKNLCVDHCHKTGKVRGLLCHHCNKGLGFFKDNLNLLRKAITYMEVYHQKD